MPETKKNSPAEEIMTMMCPWRVRVMTKILTWTRI